MSSPAEKARGVEEALREIRITGLPSGMQREAFDGCMEKFGISDPAVKRELWMAAKGVEPLQSEPASVLEFKSAAQFGTLSACVAVRRKGRAGNIFDRSHK